MSFPHDQLLSLQEAPFAVAIAEGTLLFPAIEAFHVLAFTLVVGLIARLDLSLLGIGGGRGSSGSLARQVLPLTWLAFAGAAVSGFLLFSSNAVRYFGNEAFRIKCLLLLAAGTNMLIYHAVTSRGIGQPGGGAIRPTLARVAAGLSLVLWCAVVIAGRWIGFLNPL